MAVGVRVPSLAPRTAAPPKEPGARLVFGGRSPDVACFASVSNARDPLREVGRPVFAVLGDPVAHSLSPAMHEAGLRAWGRPGVYVALRVLAEDFATAAAGAFALGLAGLNVTVPHKARALAVAVDASEAARAIGAANTLVRGERGWVAHNTDADGFVAGLGELGIRHVDRVVVLGGGGAARAVVWGLLARGVAGQVTWISRRPSALPAWAGVAARGWSELSGCLPGSDLLVDATSVGMEGGPTAYPIDPDPAVLAPGAAVVDLSYGRHPSALLRRARAAGRRTQDGRAMLLHQGVRAQALWWGDEVPARVVDAMRRALEM
ncbi:MAG: shikimate dehydrogenase [Deltaproteobacteria bacterium]|nr:MAG: shikimate dehydrogenase [Deltaproteobacteria bacterium]